MADYDFRSLSPHDFELLCRDLLQKSLGTSLESFTTGRDSGIDFRYRWGSENLIVQCKHYAESGYDALVRVLTNKERKKLDSLNPTRYILATSVGLTPTRKEELLKVVAPYCLEPADLLGREEINNLLTQHRDVERNHFKLWLTSSGTRAGAPCGHILGVRPTPRANPPASFPLGSKPKFRAGAQDSGEIPLLHRGGDSRHRQDDACRSAAYRLGRPSGILGFPCHA